MSAERNALDAALNYAVGLEGQIERLKKTIEQCSRENRLLQNKVDHVKDAVHEGGRSETNFQGQTCEASVPQGYESGLCEDVGDFEKKDPYNRCKSCGAIV